VGAVDIGVGHDDDLLVAQILVAVVGAGTAAERLDEVGELLVLGELILAGAGERAALPPGADIAAWATHADLSTRHNRGTPAHDPAALPMGYDGLVQVVVTQLPTVPGAHEGAKVAQPCVLRPLP